MLREALKRLPGARPLVHLARYHLTPTEEQVVEKTFKGRDVFFVQIGSNDGELHDPIHRLAVDNPRWSGVLVEPQPEPFARLKLAYRNQPRFRFENVAVGDRNCEQDIYTVDDQALVDMPGLVRHAAQLASFDRGHLVRHFGQEIEPYLRTIPVKCERIDTLLERCGVGRIDLLHVDAETYEWRILSQLDLARWTPEIILYEHYHMALEEKRALEAKLQAAGYVTTDHHLDTVARRPRTR